MYDRIVVPLDGSPLALHALGPARRLSELHRAPVDLITVDEHGRDGATESTERIVESGHRSAEAINLDIRQHEVVDGAAPGSALATLALDEPGSLLCMTTRGRHPLGRLLLGSVAREIIRVVHSPVVLCGPACRYEERSAVRRIAGCVDGTPEGETALDWAVRWAEATATDLSLVVLRVVYPLPDPAAGVAPTADQLDELAYATRLRTQLEAAGHEVLDVTVQHVTPADAILEVVSEWVGVLPAVASSNPSALIEIARPGTASELVRRSPTPVVVTSR